MKLLTDEPCLILEITNFSTTGLITSYRNKAFNYF